MKKPLLSCLALLGSIMLLGIVTGCDQQSAGIESTQSTALNDAVTKQQVASGAAWLNNIFRCEYTEGYCLPGYEQVFTQRYLEFYQDELHVFEYPDFATERDRIAAEQVYRNKWGDIYPLGKDIWTPFGMGNGMSAGDRLASVSIRHTADLAYNVRIDYGAGRVFVNDVLLLESDDAFLIDYIETTPSE